METHTVQLVHYSDNTYTDNNVCHYLLHSPKGGQAHHGAICSLAHRASVPGTSYPTPLHVKVKATACITRMLSTMEP